MEMHKKRLTDPMAHIEPFDLTSIPDERADVETLLDARRMMRTMKVLPMPERTRVVLLRWVDGETLNDMTNVGLTRERVRQVRNEGLRRLLSTVIDPEQVERQQADRAAQRALWAERRK